MQRHSSLLPLSHEHKRLLFVCRYLKKDAAPYEGFPLETQARFEYIVKVFQELMVPHIQKEEYLFEKCVGKNLAIDAMIKELQEEHLVISRMYSTLTDSTDLDTAMDALARSLEAHIRKEEREFFELLQRELPQLLDTLQLENQ
ncbi:hemerythrin HHE cation binding domain-containing protein [Chitinophaga polysaccharea]|uniref:Hemerythrin HHE cation binding domain-containing protein n=1 Tax=Chitinophaga polysaccharea TaxID=1293035 RepID=A0A561P331_9BACT|nr:hemerythrin domain-containing protein [Chitinophaga polysaccharea]TWF32518.1 hemerythrin HHE cation binding domain-containing protein [Chitinophaga polysaccharea]